MPEKKMRSVGSEHDSCGSDSRKIELQQILGNSVSSCAARAESEAAPLEPDSGPSGQEVLDACEGSDAALALAAVQSAGPMAANSVDEINRNALLLTAAEGHLDALLHLLGRSDFRGLGARNNIGSSALHLAAGNEHLEVCEALLASGRYVAAAPINARNDRGQTPLDFAVEFGDGVCCAALEAKGGEASGRIARRRGRIGAPGASTPGGFEAIAHGGDADHIHNDVLSHGGSTDTGGMEGSPVGSVAGSDEVTDMGSLD